MASASAPPVAGARRLTSREICLTHGIPDDYFPWQDKTPGFSGNPAEFCARDKRETMKLAGLHPDEQRRLQSLRSSGLLNSGKEERFDRLTRLARSLYNLPVASISLVGEDLLHIKSCAGLDVDTVPRDISFCAHTILQTDPLIVNDMQQDERFHDNRW
jgi:hypothetical protein